MKNPFERAKPFNPEQMEEINKIMDSETASQPDVKYERDHDPERVETIREGIETPKEIEMEFEGQKVKIEYIEVPAKKMSPGAETEKEKVIFMIPGFSASHKPYAGAVKEVASYSGDHRVICISPLDSGKSSSLKGSNLEKMSKVYLEAIKAMGIAPEKSELTIVGHSRSDIIAMNLARIRPDLVKNIALVDGIAANESNLGGLTYDFLKHVNTKITPERITSAFRGEKEEAKNYWKQNVDFFKNISNPRRLVNQFKSLGERKKVNQDEILSKMQANALVINSTEEFTDWEKTRENVFQKLPDDIQKQHRIEVGGLHDEINAHPEAFAIKLKRWLEMVEGKLEEK